MNYLTAALNKSGFLKGDLDYHLIRASMVIVFLLFGYQKWFEYEAQVLIPYISNGPLISWMYPAFGIRGASWFLGVMEWLIGLLLVGGFWSRKAGILGALGSCGTFVATVTIIPFMPGGWDEVAGGFPAMTGNIPFLIKDVALLAASFYLLRQDVVRAMRSGTADYLTRGLAKIMAGLGLLSEEVEYHLLRASMVIIFAFFGYTKWHQYAAPLMMPFISNGPFISWLYPAFGLRGATRFLGASDWTMFALLYAGFWDKRFGVLGALGATGTFLTTITIIPFVPDGWDPAAGFPAMAGVVPFLLKDVVLLAVSIYLLKQDLVRLLAANKQGEMASGMRSAGVQASQPV
ncbi:YkgB family protein [Bradyrhizobium lablabi]|uniref:YkgB family protein n=1 Tax=Bradyrhizobium lablabi TaxID=722472 RepID=UPI0032DF8012